jgi:hypothetical protein
MNDTCPDRIQFGAYVSGQLSAADEATVREHLALCPNCAQEVSELGSVVGSLRSADLSQIDREEAIPIMPSNRQLELAIFDRIDAERKRVRIRRSFVAIAAAVALIAGIAGVFALRSGPASDGLYLAMEYPVGGKANVELSKTPWGTEIVINTVGVPAGYTWGVWLERPDGSRVPAGSFTSARTNVMKLKFSSALQVDRAVAIGMTEFSSKKEVRALISEATSAS